MVGCTAGARILPWSESKLLVSQAEGQVDVKLKNPSSERSGSFSAAWKLRTVNAKDELERGSRGELKGKLGEVGNMDGKMHCRETGERHADWD